MSKKPADPSITTLTTLQPSDWLNLFRGTNPANPAAGAVDHKAQLQALINLVAANLSSITFPAVSWTPTVTSTVQPTLTGLTTVCSYKRVGDIIIARVRVDWTGMTGGSGSLYVTGPAGISLLNADPVVVFPRGAAIADKPLFARGASTGFQLIQPNNNATESGVQASHFHSGAGGVQFNTIFTV